MRNIYFGSINQLLCVPGIFLYVLWIIKCLCIGIQENFLVKSKIFAEYGIVINPCTADPGYWEKHFDHYSGVIMGAMASQITSLTIIIIHSTVYSGDQRKHQSSASLAFVRGIHRWPVNSPHKWPVTRKMFPFFLCYHDYIFTINPSLLLREEPSAATLLSEGMYSLFHLNSSNVLPIILCWFYCIHFEMWNFFVEKSTQNI